MVKHRHVAKKKGFEEKFNQSVKCLGESKCSLLKSPTQLLLRIILIGGAETTSWGERDAVIIKVGIYTQKRSEVILTPTDAENATPTHRLPASAHVHNIPHTTSGSFVTRVIVVVDSDEDEWQYPVRDPF